MIYSQADETKSVLEHISELRKKIIFVFFFFLLGFIISHIFHKEIISFILKPAGSQPLIFLSPLEPLLFIFKIDFLGGLIFSFPIIIWSVFSYIKPALPNKINHLVVLFYSISTILLILSLLYSVYVTIPISLKFLYSINIPGIENSFSVEKYLNFFINQISIIIGVFQIPILVMGGTGIGVFTNKELSLKRRYIYMGLLIILSIITPTTDIFSLGIIFIPCIVIFELSLVGSKVIENIKKN